MFEPQRPDPGGQHRQQRPAEKAQIEAEQVALAPVHERLGAFDGLGRRDGRVFGHDVRRHRVAVCGDDAGDDEQQRPREHLERDEQVEHEGAAEDVEGGKEILKLRLLAVDELQAEAVVPDRDAAAENKLSHGEHAGDWHKDVREAAHGLGVIPADV